MLTRTHQNTLCPQNTSNRKRKRLRDTEAPPDSNPAEKRIKRARKSVAGAAVEDTLEPGAASNAGEDNDPTIRYWTRHARWPKEYFEKDDQTKEHLNRDLDAERWFEKYWRPDMSHLLARKRPATSLAQKKSDTSSATPSSTTPSDQKPRKAKSALYARPSYRTILATKGSFINKFEQSITDTSKRLYSSLLKKEQAVPLQSLFCNDLFETTCRKISNGNEAIIIRDIALLIVPSAQTFTTYSATHLEQLTKGVNKGWNSAIRFYGHCL